MQECHSNVLYASHLNESRLRSADILPNGKCENFIWFHACLSCPLFVFHTSSEAGRVQKPDRHFKEFWKGFEWFFNQCKQIQTHNCLLVDGTVIQFDYGIEDFAFRWIFDWSPVQPQCSIYCFIVSSAWFIATMSSSKTKTHLTAEHKCLFHSLNLHV